LNSRRTISTFIAFCLCVPSIQSCGGNSESEIEKDYKRKLEASRAYKERYIFDVKSEKAACDKAREVASQEYQITIESCSWNGSIMELSLSKGDHTYRKTLCVKPDNQQDYRLTADVNDNGMATFLVAMTQVIRHSAADHNAL
jgi:hypothetical protein